MNTTEILKGKFDVKTHKENFVDYLEVVILEDGTIEYAVPSHQEKLISVCMKKYGINRKSVCDMCPKESYFDFMPWLCKTANAVVVWANFCIGKCNAAQKKALELLRKEGLYKG